MLVPVEPNSGLHVGLGNRRGCHVESCGHGKVILFGEHAVVHGRLALALSVGRGCVATAEALPLDSPDRLRLLPFGTEVQVLRGHGPQPPPPVAASGVGPLRPAVLQRPGGGADPGHFLPEASRILQAGFATALIDLPETRPSVAVEARLLLPAGAGLGSSAALSVAVARAIDEILGQQRQVDALIESSLRWERVCHGNPSGVDSALAVYGGLVEFRRGGAITHVVDAQIPPIVIAHSGASPTTREMVEGVAERFRADPGGTGRLFDDIEALAIAGREALRRGDTTELGWLMNLNHRMLIQLGLSTSVLDALCQRAISQGALGAKLTGGGGGGCMIAVCEDAEVAERVRNELATVSGHVFILETSQ